jgi:hypothetical protein
MEREFSLLFGAKEKDRKLIPENAIQLAEENRERIVSDPANRRTEHDFTPTVTK